MKFLLFLIILLPLISALHINEVELNPSGPDAGYEWIEFYSEEEINFEGYKIINNDEGEIILNGSCGGYCLKEFSKQWLDNFDEKIFLYYQNQLIQETPLFEDNLDNSFTFAFCKNWELVENTKGEKNNCTEEIIQQEEEESTPKDISSVKEVEDRLIEPQKELQKIIQETIELNPKTIKTTENSKESKNNYPKYSIFLFCILLLFLLIKKPKKKNEFR